MRLHAWPLGGIYALLRADTGNLLSVDCDSNDVFVAPSTVEGASREVFAARDFAPGERILPLFGQMGYDLTPALTSPDPSLAVRRYAEG